MALQLVITNTGRAAIIDQANGGFRAVRIAAVGVSPTAITAAPASANLPGEVKRIGTIAGEATATDVTHLTVTDESADSYTVRSFALYLSDGTLFALYGQADAIVQKSAQALLLLSIDVALSNIPASAITFGNANFINPAATQSRAGVIEIADDDEELAATDRTKALTPQSLNRTIRRGVGGRPIDYDMASGSLTIRGDAFGWETGYFFRGAAGATLGGFGAIGGNNAVSYFYVGTGYQAANNLRVYPSRVSYGDNTIWHAGNDGAGSGLDADLLDGWERDAVRDWNNQLNRPASVWHAGNDGAGSGLDADLLDGRNADAFLIRNYGQRPLDYDEVTGAMTLRGDPGGWSIGYNFRGSDGTWLGGLGALGSGSALTYYFIGNRFDAANTLRVYPTRVSFGDNTIWHAGNDGAGSGLDADLLDGWERDAVRDWDNLLKKPASIWHAANDGAGSGLDADLLDGRHGSSFLVRGEGGRPLDYDASAGSMTIRGDTGGWALGYFFVTPDGSPLGGFGALGGGNVPPTYYFVGNRYDAANNLRVYPSRVSYGDNTIWHAGNDGAGSGLDADLLDGWQRDDIRDWGNILNKPAAYPVAAHTHGASDIAGAFTGSLSGNGYTVLPNGLILQWVTGAQQAASSEGTQYVTFPIAFNTCFQIIVSTQVANANIESHAVYQLISNTVDGATVMRQLVSASGADREPSWPHIFAIGR